MNTFCRDFYIAQLKFQKETSVQKEVADSKVAGVDLTAKLCNKQVDEEFIFNKD